MRIPIRRQVSRPWPPSSTPCSYLHQRFGIALRSNSDTLSYLRGGESAAKAALGALADPEPQTFGTRHGAGEIPVKEDALRMGATYLGARSVTGGGVSPWQAREQKASCGVARTDVPSWLERLGLDSLT